MSTIEHEIARRYLAVWSRSLLPRRAPAAGEVHPSLLLLYVAALPGPAARGETGADRRDSEEARAVRVLDELAATLPGRRRAPDSATVFLDDDPASLARIHLALRDAGWEERVQRPSGTGTSPPPDAGTIRLLEADPAAALPGLLRQLQPGWRALFCLSPSAPAQLPLEVVRLLLQHPEADVLVWLPTTELHRLARFRDTPVADLPLHVRRLVEGYSAFFGDARFEWLARWRAVEAAHGVHGAANTLAAYYRERLAREAAGAVVRLHALAADTRPDSNARPLLLLAHEPERGLALNRILFELHSEGRLSWESPGDDVVGVEYAGMLDLFAAEGDASTPRPGERAAAPVRRTDLAGLAHRLASRFAGRTVPLREVMRDLADTGLFPDEVRRSLRLLRGDRRAEFRSLAEAEAAIRFAEPGVVLRASPSARTPAAPDGPELW